MRLYSGKAPNFCEDAAHNRIAEKLKTAFLASYRYEPGAAEVNSWRNSLRAMAQIIERAELEDSGVLLELELPLSSLRLDCMITGTDRSGKNNATIIELKQWDRCEATEGECILTFTGGGNRDVLHPSVQVGGYCQYLADTHTAFHEAPNAINLTACAYLHNYSFGEADPLLDRKFDEWRASYPVYSGDDTANLIEHLGSSLGAGGGMPILDQIEASKYRPSRKLLDHVSGLLERKQEYVLLDDQRIAFDRIMSAARAGQSAKTKPVVLVIGGPGTGKSVIALNLITALAKEGFSGHYATGSKSFTETLRKIVGTRARSLFKYFNSYSTAEPGILDVLVCDEAHRLRATAGNRYTPAANRTGKSQIQELIDASRCAVFFIDDKQVVRPDEVGSAALVREAAKTNKSPVYEIRLQAQFRCGGSDGFIQWVNNTLDIERTPTVLWNTAQQFEFKVMASPEELDLSIRKKLGGGSKARLMAGFCWTWSDPAADGTLIEDVVVGKFRRPWNAKPDATRLAKGIPKSPLWAYEQGGEGQVGCIYTAQGFEFDYAGVIFGTDLVYRSGKGWVGQAANSHDSVVKRSGEKFLDLVKNTYRVLLTRGIKGCYVYFTDKETEQFFRSRTEKTAIEYPERDEGLDRLAAEDKPSS
jgi:hypothetical protein